MPLALIPGRRENQNVSSVRFKDRMANRFQALINIGEAKRDGDDVDSFLQDRPLDGLDIYFPSVRIFVSCEGKSNIHES